MPIYLKTVYSFLTSLITIPELINFAKENKINSLSICDDNMYGVMEFILECKKNDIKPIVGLDIEKCLLFAKDYRGYQNLIKLATIKSEKELDIDTLKKYSNFLICLIDENKLDNELTNIYEDVYIYGKDFPIHKTLCLNKSDLDTLKCLHMLRDNKTYSDDYEFDASVYYQKIDNPKYNEFINKCNLVLPKYELNLPDYCKFNDTKGLNSNDYLNSLAIAGLTKRLNNKVTNNYKERLLYELDVISKMGFSNYFLIVYDYIKYAKTHDILIGPGRGSCVGSLVSFSLGITDVDPIKYDLLFERFLNTSRITMPDIDTDFPDEKRDEVINYVKDKYGKDSVANIISFGTFGVKMAIRDIGRVMNVPVYVTDDLSKKIGKMSIDEIENNDEVMNLINSDNKLKKLFSIVKRIEGIPRHSSVHASGVIISKDPLNDIIPLDYNDGRFLCAYEAPLLEDMGLLKMDFLGNAHLSIIEKILKLIKKYQNIDLRFSDIPLDDKKTYELFQNGDTNGIFQFEKNGMKKFLIKLHPDNFTDIYNANAFYRPGPASNIDSFIRRKFNKEKITYYDDSLKDILESTKGIMVYQEQIMLIARRMANFTLGDADILRRAMSKKKLGELESLKDKFINNAISNGYPKEKVLEIYNLILNFAGYGFNKSHSIAYSIISYKMAYLKANYPLYFYLSLLNSTTLNGENTKMYLMEMKKHDIKINKPDINKSNTDFVISYNTIYLPFSVIKGISSIISEKIISVRGKEFTDIYDVFTKLVSIGIPKNIYLALINSGTLDSFNYTRKTLVDNLDILINYGTLVKDLGEDTLTKPEIINDSEYTKEELINSEKEYFGFYISNHPVIYYRSKIDNCVPLINIKNYFNKNISSIMMIDKIKEITTKKNEKMAFYTCSDEESEVDIIIFPKTYESLSNFKKGDIIKVDGKVERREDYSIIANNITNVKEIV